MRYVGLDVGFGYTKATDGDTGIVIPSMVGPAVETDFKGWWENPRDQVEHLAVTLDGSSYFVGNLAIRQGFFAYGTLDRIRTQTPEYKLLFLTALALFAREPDEEFCVVTGLPVDDFEDREQIEQTLRGRFCIRLLDQEKSFLVRFLTVIPQPCGTLMDLMFEDGGAVNNIYTNGTSGSLKKGMSVIFQAAVQKFSACYSGNWDLRSAEAAIKEGGIVRFGEGLLINASLLRADFNGLAEEIAAWVKRQWEDQKVDRLVCTGGGSFHMKPYLQRHFPNIIFPNDPQRGNVRGFLKGARAFYGA